MSTGPLYRPAATIRHRRRPRRVDQAVLGPVHLVVVGAAAVMLLTASIAGRRTRDPATLQVAERRHRRTAGRLQPSTPAGARHARDHQRVRQPAPSGRPCSATPSRGPGAAGQGPGRRRGLDLRRLGLRRCSAVSASSVAAAGLGECRGAPGADDRRAIVALAATCRRGGDRARPRRRVLPHGGARRSWCCSCWLIPDDPALLARAGHRRAWNADRRLLARPGRRPSSSPATATCGSRCSVAALGVAALLRPGRLRRSRRRDV